MRLLNIAVILFVLLTSCNQTSLEQEFINENVELAKKEGKTIIVEFWSPSCSPCMQLKRDIFENDDNRAFLEENFRLIKLSPSDSIYKPLFDYFGLSSQSSVVFINKKGKEIDRTVGYNGDRKMYLNFLRDITESKNLYSDIIKRYHKDSLNVTSNFLLAKKLSYRYQHKEADIYYKNVLVYDPKDEKGFAAESSFRIAEYEFKVNSNEAKLEDYIITFEKNKYFPQAYSYLINEYKNAKNDTQCLLACRDAYKQFPENPDILNKYAWMIYTFKVKTDYKRALKMVQKAIQIRPNFANYYDTEAWLFFELGDRNHAIKAIEKAIALNPHPVYKSELEIFKGKQ